MRFSKYHGLGNDFLVIDEKVDEIPIPTAVRRICDRRFGVGADGIVVVTANPQKAPFGFRIFNSDGSEAEITGNGMRAYVRYLFENKRVGTEQFSVETLRKTLICKVNSLASVTVEMGRVTFMSDEVPMSGERREALRESLTVDGKSYTIHGAGIGNPHCVIFCSEISLDELRVVGTLLQNHPLFPKKTNVHFVKVLDRSHFEIESWERGAAYTLACGSGSSAAVAIGYRLGICEREVFVTTRGGDLKIQTTDDFDLTLTGPIVKICEGVLDPECLKEAQ